MKYSRSQVKRVFQGERSNHRSCAPRSEVLTIDSSNLGIRFGGIVGAKTYEVFKREWEARNWKPFQRVSYKGVEKNGA